MFLNIAEGGMDGQRNAEDGGKRKEKSDGEDEEGSVRDGEKERKLTGGVYRCL